MIDWIEVVVPITHKTQISGGLVDSVDEHGEHEWRITKRVRIEGSYSSSIQVKSAGETSWGTYTYLYLSGNPLKFLQGHNLFGMDDPIALAVSMAARAVERFGIQLDIFTLDRWFRGDMFFKRLDITYMHSLGSEERAHSYMQAMSRTTKLKYRGRGEFSGQTLYFGKKSRRWSLKIYPKYSEITSKKKQHKLPEKLGERNIEFLTDYARGTVRFELVLRSLELKDKNIDYGKWWGPYMARMIFEAYTEGLQMSENSKLPAQEVLDMPHHLQSTYLLWKDGHDVKRHMKKTKFYKDRKALLDHGVDISIPRDNTEEHSNVVPLRTPLEAKPLEIPEWAYGTNLYYHVR